jgi:hypothetical protein
LSKSGKLGDQEMVNVLVEDRAIEMQYCDPATSKPSESAKRKNNDHEVHHREQINVRLR